MDKRSRPAFLTGSRAYGTPRKDSDIDLVVYCEDREVQKMCKAFAKPGEASLKFGNLNLILATAEEYDVWREGTDLLVKAAPVTKEMAKHIFKNLLATCEDRHHNYDLQTEEEPLPVRDEYDPFAE